jgi:hypothetical protein
VPTATGEILSPHNLGLSILVLPAYALNGLDGVKAFLAVAAGAVIGAAYLLARRIMGTRWLCILATALVGVSAPVFVYASQIYPEMPAALLVILIVLLNIGRSGTATRGVWTGLLLAGLLWLGAKYAPLVACLGGLAALQLGAAGRAALAGTVSILGLCYLWFHLQVYGGLTPYSVNLIYAGSSTPELIAQHVEIGNRLYRLLGLWVDREFGLVRWAPVFLLAVPGVMLLRRDPGAMPWFLLPVGVQILVAVFLSITMRGWWFPGRMLVVVIPLLVPLIALGLSLALRSRAAAALSAILAAGTVSATWGLWSAASSLEVTLAVNPFDASGWWLDGTRAFWPLYTTYTWETLVLSGIWIALVGGLVWWTARTELVQHGTRSLDLGGASTR